MLLRVIKERWHEDGTPYVDPQSGPARRQFKNGGSVRVIDPRTRQARTYLPGESFDLPDSEAENLLLNAPQSVETETKYQARLAMHRQRDRAVAAERDALDARIRDLDAQQQQAQKLRAMAEERERALATENFRIAQQASGKDSQIEEMRRQMAEIQAASAAKLAEMESRLAALTLAQEAPAAAAEVAPEVPAEPRGKRKG